MTVARFVQPNYTTQAAAAYKANIDAAFAVTRRIAGAFAPHQVYSGSPQPDLAVEVDAGFVWSGGTTLLEVAAQSVSGFTIPTAGQNRIDRVVVNVLTGVATRVAGTAVTGSPTATPPAIPTGTLPVCQVLITSADTTITDSMIIDERVPLGEAGRGQITGDTTVTGSLAWGTGTATFGLIVKRKTADESVTSSVTLQDDDHLSFPIAANEEWVGTIYLAIGSAVNTTGIRAGLNVPAGATLSVNGTTLGNGNTHTSGRSTVSGLFELTQAGDVTGSSVTMQVQFWVLNGATPGTVQFQFAQGTSSGTALTAFKGSFLTATRIA